MAFGIYIHIPYCLQRCHYCDFATYVQEQSANHILPPEEYVVLLYEEMQQRISGIQQRKVDSIYFGGGTPSLLEPTLIVNILNQLKSLGFITSKDCEITLEINPATITKQKMEVYLQGGVNRFSVGAQTFNDRLLESLNRQHRTRETLETLALLRSFNVNISVDLIFGLPHQNLSDLERDCDQLLEINPDHISPYCLTLPEGHWFNANRPLEPEQIEMFSYLTARLRAAGYDRYEISNFAKPGKESRHNSLYWEDQSYWGLGLGAHSYEARSEDRAPWGVRYWNSPSMKVYGDLIRGQKGKKWDRPYAGLPQSQFETLRRHESMTDFCHTSLRRSQGLSLEALMQKFGEKSQSIVLGPLNFATSEGWLYQKSTNVWSLTDEGVLVSNSVFQHLTFLEAETAP